MDYLIFSAASTFEYVAVFAFMLALFRFRLTRRAVINVAIVSVMMSQVSYFTRSVPAIGEMSTFIQLALYILALWLLFQAPFFYSIIMNFAGLAAVIIVQGAALLIFQQAGIMTADSVTTDVWNGAGLQAVSSLIIIAAAYTIVSFNAGFNFVPTSRRTYTHFSRANIAMLIVVLIATMAGAAAAYLYANTYDVYVLIACVIFALMLPFYYYFAWRREYEDAK